MSGIRIIVLIFAASCLCVYLPPERYDYFDDYMFFLTKISQIIDSFQTLCASQFGDELCQQC